jgi:hypothetical protein
MNEDDLQYFFDVFIKFFIIVLGIIASCFLIGLVVLLVKELLK